MTVKVRPSFLKRPLLHVETKHLYSLAFAVIALNVPLGSSVLARLLPASQLERFDLGGFVRSVHAASAVAVIALLALRRRLRGTLRVWHALLGGVAVLALGEAFLRVTLFTRLVELPLVEYPGFYADPFSDDDFWVLEYRWSGTRRPRQPATRDPVLGWTASNGGALGVSGAQFRDLADVTERPVLFFGDSFVADLPERLEARLPGHDVLDYGVGGYGTDQILMRAERQVPLFRGRDPIVLIGVLLEDMDRSLLRFRGGQKPYFTIESGTLVEHHPRFASNEEFLDRHEFRRTSFLLAALVGSGRLLTRRFDGDPARRMGVNRLLFRRGCQQLERQGLRALFVVFLGLPELRAVASGQEPARLGELRTILRESCRAPAVETSSFLLDAAQREPLEAFYIEDGHHSALANERIARGLAEVLRHAPGRN